MSAPIHMNEDTFEEEVLKSEIPVMVDFWADWCAPCKMIEPLVEKIANEYRGKLKVAKVDVDENSNIAASLGIRSIPTIMFFKRGEVVEQIIGAVPEAQLKKVIKKVLGE